MASGRIERTIPFFIGTEPADVGMDDLTPVTRDYQAYDNEFTGTIRKIVVGVGPMGEAFDPPLEWHGRGKALTRLVFHVYEFRAGKVVSLQSFLDRSEALEAADLAEKDARADS